MIKNVIKKLFPKLDSVKEEKILKIFGPAVLQLIFGTLTKICIKRFAIGAFCAFIPIPGVQMILAAFLSITFAGNLPLSVVLTWISNPFTYAPIIYIAIKVGEIFIEKNINYEIKNDEINMLSDYINMWEPLIIGSLILGIIASLLSYFLIRLYWVYYVKKIWLKRKNN